MADDLAALLTRVAAHHAKLNALAPACEGNISWGSTQAYAETLWALKQETLQLQNKPRILKIGFNAGHSYALLAELFPDSEIVAADLFWHPYSTPTVEYCRQNFTPALTTVAGNTLSTLCTIQGAFDLIFIDGGHDVDVPYADLENCKQLARTDTYIFMDDVCPQYYGEQPTAAWEFFKARNAVVEHGRWLMADGRLGFAYGKYTFAEPPQDVCVVVAHYNEDLTWLDNLRYPTVVISKQGIPFETPPNRGQEASGYLTWILDNYDELPEYVVFLHGHQTSWHNRAPMDPIVNGVVFYKQYKNLNDPDPTPLGPGDETYQQCFRELSEILGQEIKAEEIVFRCCAQFYVHRDCIRRHPRETYQKLYDWLMTTPVGSHFTSRCFEYTWHLIFTGSHKDIR